MNLVKLCGHTIDESLLPEIPVVLDVGSRDFHFTKALLQIRPRAFVVAMDPDKGIPAPINCLFWNMALVGDGKTKSNYASYSTGEGNMLLEGNSYYDAKIYEVACIDIQTLMRHCKVNQWDLVKLDCEGSEFDILWNWPGPIAKQISVEFHDGADPAHRHDQYFAGLFERLLVYYRVVQHEKFQQGAWWGHWDSVLVLKYEKR